MKHLSSYRKILPVMGIVALTLAFGMVTHAKYEPKDRNNCALSVQPYKASAGGTSNQVSNFDHFWQSIFNENSDNCTDFLQYPNQYKQPPKEENAPLPNRAGIENKTMPETQHNHAYFNDSVEDADFYYKSFVSKYQITLEADALKNVHTNLIVCLTPTEGKPQPTVGCNGEFSLYGGTKVSFNPSTGVITWEFGRNQRSEMPHFYGKNPGLKWVPDMPDTSKDENREFEPAVLMLSKDNSAQKIWSATTTARVLVRDQAILKTSVNKLGPNYGYLLGVGACANDGKPWNVPDYTKWCTLPTPFPSSVTGVEEKETVDGKDYYWFRIGVVGTVWRTPPKKVTACTGLALSPSSVEANTPVTFNVTPSFSNGELPLDYRWESKEVGLNQDINQQGFGQFVQDNLLADLNDFNIPPSTKLDLKNIGPFFPPNFTFSSTGNNTSSGGTSGSASSSGSLPGQVSGSSSQQESSGSSSSSGGLNPANFPINSGSGVDGSLNPSAKPSGLTPDNFPISGAGLNNDETSNGSSGSAGFNSQNFIIDGSLDPSAKPSGAAGESFPANGRTQKAKLGVFADSASARDFGNPYLDVGYFGLGGKYVDDTSTYYTGGNPSDKNHGILVTVTGVNKDTGEDEPECRAQTIIRFKPPEKPVLSCRNITVDFTPKPFNPTGSTQITAKVTLEDQEGNPVLYPGQIHWATQPGDQGTFKFNQQQGNPLDTATQSGASTVSYSGGQETTQIRIRPTDPDYANDPDCQAVILPNQVPPKICTSLTIYRNNVIFPSSIALNDPTFPTDNLKVVPVKDAGLTLNYRWRGSTDNGANLIGNFTSIFNNNLLGPGNPLTMPSENYLTSYSGASTTRVTNVRVEGYDITDPNKTTVCYDQFDIIPPGAGNVCLALNPRVNGQSVANSGYQFDAGKTYLLSAAPQNVQLPAPPSVMWAETGNGFFSAATSDPVCNNPALTSFNAPASSNTSFVAPAYCSYNYTAATGGQVFQEVVDPNVPPVPASCRATFTVKEEVCLNLQLTQVSENRYCVDVTPPGLLGQVQWTITNGTLTVDNDRRCATVVSSDNSTLRAEVPGSNACVKEVFIPKRPPRPPRLEKAVSIHNQNNYRGTVSISSEDLFVDYRLTFVPGEPNTTATITDPIAQGLQGRLLPGNLMGGTITYANNMVVSVNRCSAVQTTNCYNGDIGSPGGITLIGVSQPVTITYQGKVNTKINPTVCETGIYCEEVFLNKARIISAHVIDSQNKTIQFVTPIESNEARVQIFCQYILSRAAGDIYLETDLGLGIDIYICTKYKTGVGPIITPRPPAPGEIVKSGAGEVFQFNSGVCKGTTLPGNLSEYYGDTSKLSSTICELKLTPNSTLEKSSIVANLQESIKRLSRWEPNLVFDQISGFNNLLSTNGVYRHKGDLTIDAGNQPFIKDGEGARTIIVEGDLKIKSNIKIGPCEAAPCTFRQTASLAFIVLDGNIYVDKDVTSLAGVYVAIQGKEGTGYVFSGKGKNQEEISRKQLVINGSIIGDMGPLVKKRIYAGEAAKNEGSVVVRWDLRIMNTPPGLQDLLDLKSTQVGGQ